MPTAEEIWGIIADAVPLIRGMAAGRYAISIGGSHGKGTAYHDSDVDFRLFCDGERPDSAERRATLAAFHDVMAVWRQRGVEIDGCWVRRIGDVEREMEAWLAGRPQPTPKVWAIWGYYLLPDLSHQHVLEDPSRVIAGWQDRLRRYPPALKQAVLDEHLASLTYWRNDYHYRNKARRGDAVFLAGLSARLVHDLLQVICALNETYYPGDGDNLAFSRRFGTKPERFEERIEAVLYASASVQKYERQRASLVELIDDVLALAGARLDEA